MPGLVLGEGVVLGFRLPPTLKLRRDASAETPGSRAGSGGGVGVVEGGANGVEWGIWRKLEVEAEVEDFQEPLLGVVELAVMGDGFLNGS